MKRILVFMLFIITFPALCFAKDKLKIEYPQFDLYAATSVTCNTPSIRGETRDITHGGYSAFNIDNIKVDIFQTNSTGKISKTGFKSTTRSDENGDFKFCSLATGTYLLKAKASGYAPVRNIVELPSKTDGYIILGMYLRGLLPKYNSAIEGHFFDSKNNPIEGINIKIIGTKTHYKETTTTEGWDGEFVFYYLKPDTYELTARKGQKTFNKTISLTKNLTYTFYKVW